LICSPKRVSGHHQSQAEKERRGGEKEKERREKARSFPKRERDAKNQTDEGNELVKAIRGVMSWC
jgi:hypothetical protein